MPRKKNYPVRKSKRRYRRRRRYWPRPTKSLQRTGFAKSALVKLRYTTTLSLNPGAGTPGTNVFSANGLYDPDITGVGHQPMSFDQWMTFYDHYTVLGSKISANFMNPFASFLLCGIDLRDKASAVTTNIENIAENAGTIYTNLEPVGSGRPMKTLRKTFSAKKFFTKRNVRDEKDLEGTSGANPVEQAYFHVWLMSADGSSDPGATFPVQVTIEYIALFTEPKAINAS